MATKTCTGKCGETKPISEFYSKGAECRECNKTKRRDNNKANGKIRYVSPETLEIQEKYKDDPVEMQRQLNNAKAKRARERQKEAHTKGEIKKITEKVCKGALCKGIKLLVEKFTTQLYGDGYQTYCKECVKYNNAQKSESFKDVDLKNTSKSCKNVDCSCDNPQSLTEFDKHVNYEFGRNDICKTCRQVERSKLNYPRQESGTKFCTGHSDFCDVSKFHSDKFNTDGLHSCCIKCQNQRKCTSYSKYPCAISLILKDARNNAKKRNIKFSIKFEDIDELYLKQDGKCAMTGIQMTYSYMKVRQEDDHHIINPTNMSIDRIHNSGGYTKNNIQLVCAVVNRIKHDMNPFELMFFVTTVGNHAVRKQALQLGLIKEQPIILTTEMSKRIEQKYKYTYSNAKKRKLDVTVTQEELNELYMKQNGKCAITGQVLTCDKSLCDISIDRIDSNKYYTSNNVQLVLDSANQRKADLSNDELEHWINSIRKSPLLLSQIASI